MVSEAVERLLNHPKRKLIAWGATVLFALLFVLPAWEQFAAAREEVSQQSQELLEIRSAISNLDLMQARLAKLEADDSSTQRVIDGDTAEQIREQVTRLVIETGCRVRRLTLSDPFVREWAEGDDPFELQSRNRDGESGFLLETRTLALKADGSLANVTKLTIALTKLGRFAVPSNMTIRREGIDGHLMLASDISLFNLVENHD